MRLLERDLQLALRAGDVEPREELLGCLDVATPAREDLRIVLRVVELGWWLRVCVLTVLAAVVFLGGGRALAERGASPCSHGRRRQWSQQRVLLRLRHDGRRRHSEPTRGCCHAVSPHAAPEMA